MTIKHKPFFVFLAQWLPVFYLLLNWRECLGKLVSHVLPITSNLRRVTYKYTVVNIDKQSTNWLMKRKKLTHSDKVGYTYFGPGPIQPLCQIKRPLRSLPSSVRHHFFWFSLMIVIIYSFRDLPLSALKSHSLVLSHSKVRNSSPQALWKGRFPRQTVTA